MFRVLRKEVVLGLTKEGRITVGEIAADALRQIDPGHVK
jgi:hypothetical protein